MGAGNIITTDGRSMVMKDPEGETLPEGWLPQPFNDVNDDPSDLNGEQCVLAMGGEASMAEAGKELDEMEIRFFTAPEGGVGDQLYKLTQLEGNKLVFMDIPNDGAFYVCESAAVDASVVRSFISDVKGGKAERRQLKK